MPDADDLIREAVAHHRAAATLLSDVLDGEKAGVPDADKLAVVQQAKVVGGKADAALRRAGRALAGLSF